MKKLLYGCAIVLLVGAVIHLAIILMIPYFAAKDAWAKLSADAKLWEFSVVALPSSKTSELPQADPSVGVAACLFDLNEAPLRIEAGSALPFWSVAVFDRLGRNIYSFNDRTAIERQLLLVVFDPVQKARALKEAPDEMENAVVVETTSRFGFVLLRTLQPDASWQEGASAFLSQASCGRYDLEGLSNT